MHRRVKRAAIRISAGVAMVGGVTLLLFFYVPKFRAAFQAPGELVDESTIIDESVLEEHFAQAFSETLFEPGAGVPLIRLPNGIMREDFRIAREQYLSRPAVLLSQATRLPPAAAILAPRTFVTANARGATAASGGYGWTPGAPRLASPPRSLSNGALGYAILPATTLTGLSLAGQAGRPLSLHGLSASPAFYGTGNFRVGSFAAAVSAPVPLSNRYDGYGYGYGYGSLRYSSVPTTPAPRIPSVDLTPRGTYQGEGAASVTTFNYVLDPVVLSSASLAGPSGVDILFDEVVAEPVIETLPVEAISSPSYVAPSYFSYSSVSWSEQSSEESPGPVAQLQETVGFDTIVNPEPATWSLIGVGLIAIVGGMRFSRRRITAA